MDDTQALSKSVQQPPTKIKRVNALDKKTSGTSPETSELQLLLEDLGNQEEDAESQPVMPTEEEQKRLDGQEMQKRACESFADTRKRLFTDKENTSPFPLQPSKKRNSGSDTLHFLSKKIELEREMRKEEPSIKKAELERKEREEERRRLEETERERRFELLHQQQQQIQQQLMQHQQQMQRQFLQQQQQMQNMMVLLMQTLKGENSKN